ncbi:MAG: penicillin-binding protein 2 [Bdellovibrionales bacterium]|nr:penicillin-binding protein 2 [Bdellovibrionales bacterium]
MSGGDYLNNPEQEAKEYNQRYKYLYIIVGLASLLILGRLWHLQIIQGQELRQYSERNRVKEVKIPAPRGLMLDRNGEVLVDNLTGFEATISPQYAKKLEETAKAVAKALDLETEKIIKDVKRSKRQNGPFRAVKIKDNLSMDEVFRLKILMWDHPSLRVRETIVRHYPLEVIGAQLFGYVSEISKSQIEKFNNRFSGKFQFEQGDIIGKQGLEQEWESEIRGFDGLDFVEVDARGRQALTDTPTFLGFESFPETPGKNLVLTIDKDLQLAASEAMNQQDKIGPRIGGLVAVKDNGEILAWVNSPSFDPNIFATGSSSKKWRELINDPFKPLRNKIIQDHYPPGSIFKPIVGLAALEENVITPTTAIQSPSQLKFGRRIYHNHSRVNYGAINVKQALEVSSNVFFYKMGISLGINNIAKYARALGIGEKTEVKMRDERSGLMPTEEWKQKTFGERWQPGENLSNAIGQGFILTTPLQMALAFNAIGQEGKLYKPLIVRRVINNRNEVIKEFEPELKRDLSRNEELALEFQSENSDSKTVTISKNNFKTIKEGLRRVANGDRGTARWWKIPGVEIAGKTGTAQVRSFSADQIYNKCTERDVDQRHHGWFVGYAPAEKPVITVAVLAEHACAGSSGGAPVVRDVIRAYIEKYHPEWIKQPKPRKKKIVKAASPAPATETPAEESGDSSDELKTQNEESSEI